MASNEILPFAESGTALVTSQVDYAALTARTEGFQNGVASPAQANKVWRQCAFIATAFAQWIVNTINVDVLDDGDVNALVDKIVKTNRVKPIRSVSAAAPAITLADFMVECDATANNVAPALPVAADTYKGHELVFIKMDNSAHYVAPTAGGADTILTTAGAVASVPLNFQGNRVRLIRNNANTGWNVIGE